MASVLACVGFYAGAYALSRAERTKSRRASVVHVGQVALGLRLGPRALHGSTMVRVGGSGGNHSMSHVLHQRCEPSQWSMCLLAEQKITVRTHEFAIGGRLARRRGPVRRLRASGAIGARSVGAVSDLFGDA